MLYVVLQLSYGLRDDTRIDAKNITEFSSKSSVLREELMAWAIQEVSSVLNNTVIPSQSLSMEDFAEARDNSMFQEMQQGIINSVERSYQMLPSVNFETHAHFYYCQVLHDVLREFDKMMQNAPIRSTDYFTHYQENLGLVNELLDHL